MEVALSEASQELLEVLRQELTQRFMSFDRPNLVQLMEQAEYNDLIAILHLGFSEKACFDSLRGMIDTTSFDLSEDDLNEVFQGLQAIIKGGR